MYAVLNVAIPVFAIIAAGYLVGRFRLLGDTGPAVINGFVYYISMPALFIMILTSNPISATANVPFLSVVIAGQLSLFGLALLMATILFPASLGRLSQHSLAAVLTNSGYMGIPLMQLAFGDQAALLAILATLVNGVLFLSLGSVLLSIHGNQDGPPGNVLKGVLRSVFTSPLVLGAITGLFLAVTELGLPSPIFTPISMLGETAGPCALFAIGLFLVGKRVPRPFGEIAWVSFLKIVLLPLVTWIIALFIIPLDDLELAVAVLMAALPTGSLVFVLGEKHRIFLVESVAVVLVTTLVSVVSVSILLGLFLSTP